MNKIITKRGNHVIEKLSEFVFKINVDDSKKMNVPVTIYADDNLILKMSEDRTLDQACKCLNTSWCEKTCSGITRWS